MGLFSWIFKRQTSKTKVITVAASEKLVEQMSALFSQPKYVIKTPPKTPQELVKKPRKPRRSPAEMDAERAHQHLRMVEHNKRRAFVDRDRQLSTGIIRYKWSTSGDKRTCAACAANDGKIFSWNKPPKTGHPGEGLCCQEDEGYCRCVALPIV